MSSLNFLYATPLFPVFLAVALIWGPWFYARTSRDDFDKGMQPVWFWLNIVLSGMLLYAVGPKLLKML